MAAWKPGRDPFPVTAIAKITDLEYLDELKFVRHARVHVKKTPQSLLQLSADFGARMTAHPKGGDPYPLTITAPRGLYTDLASVPKALWWVAATPPRADRPPSRGQHHSRLPLHGLERFPGRGREARLGFCR